MHFYAKVFYKKVDIHNVSEEQTSKITGKQSGAAWSSK